MPLSLDTKIEQLTRVGRATAARIAKLGVHTVADLLRHYPFRYDDFGQLLPIAKLAPGTTATVRGRIELIENRRSPRRRLMLTEAVIADASGSIQAVWFNQPYLTRVFHPGDEVFVAGSVSYEFHQLQFVNPSLELCQEFTLHTARLVPIYPATERITQRQIRFLVRQALAAVDFFADPLPPAVRQKYNFSTLAWAIRQIHFPERPATLARAWERLKFDELFLLQLAVQLARQNLAALPAHPIPFQPEMSQRFVKALGFQLTDDQRKAAWRILQDIGKGAPMNRLLEGEVGSGKTVVVAMAALNTASAGFQTVVMAPTEILAEQHFKTFARLFSGWPVAVALLTRSRRAVQPRQAAEPEKRPISKRALLSLVQRGEVDLVVGTHALLQESVRFKDLALAVVDEQHRFGVEQRQRLKSVADKVLPHFLSLTATPIPRTLALMLYGDLAISAIRQLPRERKPITTRLVTPLGRARLYQFIREQISVGRQAFVICPLIDPSDRLGVRAATDEGEKLQREVFPALNVGVLHGKLSADKKAAVMAAFTSGAVHILVSTTVVEVGVDIPNASTIVIEGAERFGLSQLHQLRGRVGRSGHQSYCFLCTDAETGDAYERLSAFLQARDGFEIAELDLRYRGPGQILGSVQSGFAQLKLASFSDLALAQNARHDAAQLLSDDPKLTHYPMLAVIAKQFGSDSHLE